MWSEAVATDSIIAEAKSIWCFVLLVDIIVSGKLKRSMLLIQLIIIIHSIYLSHL